MYKFNMLPHVDIVIRLVLAAFLGSLIGFERELKNWAAGLRTHMLVCVGSALVMIVSAFGFEDVLLNERVLLDPSRVAAQVVSGIGFLGAGSILLWHNKVIRGLTTAASLWATAAVGLAVGGGLYFSALVTTIIVLIILAGLKPLEYRFKKNHFKEIYITAGMGTISLENLEKMLAQEKLSIKQIRIQSIDAGHEEIAILLNEEARTTLLSVIEEVRKLPGIVRIDFDR